MLQFPTEWPTLVPGIELCHWTNVPVLEHEWPSLGRSLFSPNLSLAWAGAFVGIGLTGCSGGIGIHWSDKNE